MPDQPSDVVAVRDDSSRAEVVAESPVRRSSRRATSRRTDWRLGGRTVRRWRESLIAWGFFSLGIAIFVGYAVTVAWPTPAGALLANVVLWVGMLLPIVLAFSRSRPIGLLKFRALDVLYGLVLGILLRLLQGWLAVAGGAPAGFPSLALLDGALPASWWLTDAVPAVLISPVLEEFLFRAVLLVSLYTVLRRPFGKPTAGFAALLVTTALFVIAHAINGDSGNAAVLSLTALGAVCAALVLLTGRIWPAVITHIVFNGSYIVLVLVGTYLG